MSVVHTVFGGGGGSAYAYAKVSYPAGSKCTCTQGSTVLTAPDTNGTCIFVLKGNGSYTIRTFDGSTWETSSKRKEQTISVARQYQIFVVTLSYKTYIYNRGASTGYIWEAHGSETSFVNYATYFRIIGSPYSACGARLNANTYVDVTDFTKLTMVYSVESQVNNTCIQQGYCGQTSFSSAYSPLHTELSLEVNISRETGSVPIVLLCGLSNQCVANIYEIYLE